jgi:hypothetical protein
MIICVGKGMILMATIFLMGGIMTNLFLKGRDNNEALIACTVKNFESNKGVSLRRLFGFG